MLSPRNTPSRHDFYMGLAWIYGAKSKDPNTQVGAVVVSSTNKVLGLGYNGPPNKIKDEELDWSRPLVGQDGGKYPYIFHAEKNAIRRASRHPDYKENDVTVYVTGKPCKGCMLDLVDACVKEIIHFPFISDPNSSLRIDSNFDYSEDIAERGSIILTEYNGNLDWITDWVDKLKTLGVFSLNKSI